MSIQRKLITSPPQISDGVRRLHFIGNLHVGKLKLSAIFKLSNLIKKWT